MTREDLYKKLQGLIARGGILVFFIMAFEVMIMISPFAFFFYSVFNPILHWLQDYSATRWLTNFFLPHMILPPTFFLKFVRILGSIMFVAGALTFTVCALQVYLGKIFKWGIAARGLYGFIRHPQYFALGMWGIGMSILWPRFLVLASLSLMFILYYFLARDEERRMLFLFGEGYREYMEKTGMFLPGPVEKAISAPFRQIQGSVLKPFLIAVSIPIIVIGAGFLLRAVTLDSLPMEAGRNITLVSILPEDVGMNAKILSEVGGGGASGQLSFLKPDKDYLGYVMPPDYIMQGMIADTGGSSHLHQHHNTFALIADWIFNPFEHLRRSPSAAMAAARNVDPAMARRHHCPLQINDAGMDCNACPYRRVVFVEIDHEGKEHLARTALFSIGSTRFPVGFMDINAETGRIVKSEKVGAATAWMDVPTPAI